MGQQIRYESKVTAIFKACYLSTQNHRQQLLMVNPRPKIAGDVINLIIHES